jgi:hypothetical protein
MEWCKANRGKKLLPDRKYREQESAKHNHHDNMRRFPGLRRRGGEAEGEKKQGEGGRYENDPNSLNCQKSSD